DLACPVQRSPHSCPTRPSSDLASSEGDGLLEAGIAAAAHLVLEPEPTLAPGTRVGAFDVIGVLGRGGMGTVYAANDRHLDRPVADRKSTRLNSSHVQNSYAVFC